MDLAPVARRADVRGRVHLAAGSGVLVQRRRGRQVRDARSRSGCRAPGVAATAKHFPGVGSASVDTDNKLDELRPDQGPAPRRTGALPSTDPSWTRRGHAVDGGVSGLRPQRDAPTALSRPIVQGLLRGQLRFRGVTITDALGTPTGHDESHRGRARRAAGADILLYTDSASGELPALQARPAQGPDQRRRGAGFVPADRRAEAAAWRAADAARLESRRDARATLRGLVCVCRPSPRAG